MKVFSYFEKYPAYFLTIASLLFFFLRFPSLFEPYWYGDEGIYFVIGDALRNGRVLYDGIWDNKPPLLYVFYQFFGQNLFDIRFLSLIFGLGALTAFYFLAKKILVKPLHVISASILFVLLTGLPSLEGNIANAENFMLLPILLGFYLVFRDFSFSDNSLHDKLKTYAPLNIYFAGLFFGLAFMIKIVGVFDLAALIFFFFLISSKGNNNLFLSLKRFTLNNLSFLKTLVLGFITPTFIYSLYAVFQDNLIEFLTGAFLSNVTYVGVENNFIIPQGFLIFKTILLIVALFLLFIKRHLLPLPFLFVLSWFVFSFYNVFFSQRPYGHYLLLLVPSLIFLFFMAFNFKRFKKPILLSVGVVGILLFLTFHLFMIPRTLTYYVNFLTFVTGSKSTNSYLGYFDWNTPRDYTIATFIKSNTEKSEHVFIWGDSAQIYFMAKKIPPGKYSVSYHIINSKIASSETEKSIIETDVKYIILMPNTKTLPFSLSGYQYKMTIEEAAIYERIE